MLPPMNRTSLADVLRTQLRELLSQLPRAQRGRVTGVHRARVASRRLREALPVAGHEGTPREVEALRRDVRRVTAALGRVREMDVAIAEFDRSAAAAEWTGVAAVRVRRHLEAERKRRERDVRAKLARVNLKRVDDRTRALSRAVEHAPVQGWQTLLGVRLRKRSRRLAHALRAAGTLYAPDALHAARVAGKKLRYTLELAHQAAGVECRAEINALRRVQDLLGRLRDLQVLQDHVQQASVSVASDLKHARAIEEIREEIEAECRGLHARFLRRAARLLELADRVGRETAAALVVHKAVRMARLRTPTPRRPPRAASA